jgi:hypothetical protein
MATIQDYRRTDIQTNSNKGAFWLTSKAIDGHEISSLKDKACVLFSFPVVGQQIIIREIAVHIIKGFTANTTLELGIYTIANDDISTDGTATLDDSDTLVPSIDIQSEVVGWYYPTAGNFVDAQASGVTISGENLLIGAAVNVPVIAITPKVATIIEGQAQVSILVCIVPNS